MYLCIYLKMSQYWVVNTRKVIMRTTNCVINIKNVMVLEGMMLVIKALEILFSTINNIHSTLINAKTQVVLSWRGSPKGVALLGQKITWKWGRNRRDFGRKRRKEWKYSKERSTRYDKIDIEWYLRECIRFIINWWKSYKMVTSVEEPSNFISQGNCFSLSW